MFFRKMHGLGNDFVVLDARQGEIVLPPERIRLIGDRRRGIGFDQLLVLEPTGNPDADVFMRIYNSDGSEAGACGNGTRCVADLLMQESAETTVRIETASDLLSAEHKGDVISVDMGQARVDWQDIPLAEEVDTLHLPIQQGPLKDPVGVNMGNPHCIFFVEDAQAIALEELGPILEHHALYPERTNVEVASVLKEGGLRLRVWERGAGITMACGSGTCATAVAAHRRGLADAETTPLRIILDGGEMTIEWRASTDGHVIMTGPSTLVCHGEADL